jgi:hypothetical protein
MSERSEPFFADDDLERQLRLLADSIAFPSTPDIATAISAELHAQLVVIHRRRRWIAPAIVAAAIVLLLLGGSLALFPRARHAVAGWFDLPGISIFVGDTTPTPGPATPEPPLSARFGPPVSLAQASAAVDFPILLPDHPGFAGGSAIYVAQQGTQGQTAVLIAYPVSDTLPEAAQSGAGLLIVEFSATSDSVWAMKSVNPGTTIEVVQVNGHDALWIGGTHMLTLIPGDTSVVPGTPIVRESANMLAWNINGVTYRLEADLPLDTMIAIAESLAPIP